MKIRPFIYSSMFFAAGSKTPARNSNSVGNPAIGGANGFNQINNKECLLPNYTTMFNEHQTKDLNPTLTLPLDQFGYSEITNAAKLGDVTKIKTLAESDSRLLSQKDGNGQTAIIVALKYNQLDAVKMIAMMDRLSLHHQDNDGKNIFGLVSQTDFLKLLNIVSEIDGNSTKLLLQKEIYDGNSILSSNYSFHQLTQSDVLELVSILAKIDKQLLISKAKNGRNLLGGLMLRWKNKQSSPDEMKISKSHCYEYVKRIGSIDEEFLKEKNERGNNILEAINSFYWEDILMAIASLNNSAQIFKELILNEYSNGDRFIDRLVVDKLVERDSSKDVINILPIIYSVDKTILTSINKRHNRSFATMSSIKGNHDYIDKLIDLDPELLFVRDGRGASSVAAAIKHSRDLHLIEGLANKNQALLFRACNDEGNHAITYAIRFKRYSELQKSNHFSLDWLTENDKRGRHAITTAKEYGHLDLLNEMFTYDLKGTHFGRSDANGFNVMTMFFNQKLKEDVIYFQDSISNLNENIVEFFIENVPTLFKQSDANGFNIMTISSFLNDSDMIKVLKKHDRSLMNLMDTNGYTSDTIKFASNYCRFFCRIIPQSYTENFTEQVTKVEMFKEFNAALPYFNWMFTAFVMTFLGKLVSNNIKKQNKLNRSFQKILTEVDNFTYKNAIDLRRDIFKFYNLKCDLQLDLIRKINEFKLTILLGQDETFERYPLLSENEYSVIKKLYEIGIKKLGSEEIFGKCPISKTTLKSPVLAVSGHHFERSYANNWQQQRGANPITNQAPFIFVVDEPFQDIINKVNNALKRIIRAQGKQKIEKLKSQIENFTYKNGIDLKVAIFKFYKFKGDLTQDEINIIKKLYKLAVDKFGENEVFRVCPISTDPIKKAVLASSGHHFESACAKEWSQQGTQSKINPATNKPPFEYLPDQPFEDFMEEYKKVKINSAQIVISRYWRKSRQNGAADSESDSTAIPIA